MTTSYPATASRDERRWGSRSHRGGQGFESPQLHANLQVSTLACGQVGSRRSVLPDSRSGGVRFWQPILRPPRSVPRRNCLTERRTMGSGTACAHLTRGLAVDSIRRRGCAAAGVRLAGPEFSAVCRLDLYGAWRLLSVFETPDRCVLLVVAEHTRSANPYQPLYEMLGRRAPRAAHQASLL